ncbi:MAG: glycosyltransferase family 4 protein [Acidobacteria bacterium]|nr:glycosyltransferase family 4 protein [Acidobacteriota bacterium]
MKVALVSPLPPTRSGIADYAARLGRELAKHMDVVEIDPPDLNRIDQCDVALYHMGNSGLHGAVYEAALAKPGVVVLHDAMLQHFALGWFPREQYVEEFVYNYGEWSRDRAEQLWLQRRVSAADQRYFRHPLLRRLVEHSRAIIVHNPAAAHMARQAVPAGNAPTPVYEVPHFIDQAAASSSKERQAIRSELSVADGETLISCLGYLRPAKRVRTLLDAAGLLSAPHRLLLAGEFSAPDYEQALSPRLDNERVIRRPYVSEREFERLLQATDIGVNLRYPSAGETSGLVMCMMAHGKAVLVTRNEENSALPDDAVIRVDPGESETEMLAFYLQWLVEDADARAYFGRNAAAYVNRRHSLEEVAGHYLGILETHWVPENSEPPFTTGGPSVVESNRD